MTVEASALPSRAEVPVEYTWNLDSVFATEAAWTEEVAALTTALAEADRFHGRLAESAALTADWLELRDQWMVRALRVHVYGGMGAETDTTDTAAAARRGRSITLQSRVIAATAFTEPELLAIGFPTLRQWLTEESRLAPYAHYLDALEEAQAHVRSAEVEEVLGLANDPYTASGIHRILADADLRFAPAHDSAGVEIALAQGAIQARLTSPDREVRRTAWESYADSHLAMKNTMAACLATGVKQDVFRARVRRYPSSLEVLRSPTTISRQARVLHNLIATFRKNLPPPGIAKLGGADAVPSAWTTSMSTISGPRLANARNHCPFHRPWNGFFGGSVWLAPGRRREYGDGAARRARGALGRHLPQSRQALRSLLRRRSRHPPFYPDELQQRCVRAEHPGP